MNSSEAKIIKNSDSSIYDTGSSFIYMIHSHSCQCDHNCGIHLIVIISNVIRKEPVTSQKDHRNEFVCLFVPICSYIIFSHSLIHVTWMSPLSIQCFMYFFSFHFSFSFNCATTATVYYDNLVWCSIFMPSLAIFDLRVCKIFNHTNFWRAIHTNMLTGKWVLQQNYIKNVLRINSFWKVIQK